MVSKGLSKQFPNPTFLRNFCLVSSFTFCFLCFCLLIISTAIQMFVSLFSLVRTFLNCQVASQVFLKPNITDFQIKSERVQRSVLSLLSAEELLVLIPSIILISIGNTLLVLVCFDFSELQVDLYVFSQLGWLLSSTRNSLCFQLCFGFAMHHGSLHCPFKSSFIKRRNRHNNKILFQSRFKSGLFGLHVFFAFFKK